MWGFEMKPIDKNSFHVKLAVQNMAFMFAVEPRFASTRRAPEIIFVSMGKALKGGTHRRIKAFALEGAGTDRPTLRNVTGHLCALTGITLDTYDLSMVVRRDTIMFRNMADQFSELSTLRDMVIDWQ